MITELKLQSELLTIQQDIINLKHKVLHGGTCFSHGIKELVELTTTEVIINDLIILRNEIKVNSEI